MANMEGLFDSNTVINVFAPKVRLRGFVPETTII